MAKPQKVINGRVIDQLDMKNVLLVWSPVPSSPPLLGFDVYRSLTDQFADAVKVNTALVVVAQYLASEPQTLRQDAFYFIVAVNRDGESEPSDAIPVNAGSYQSGLVGNMQFIVPEFMRRRRLILDLDGEEAVFLLRRVAGTFCSCYDAVRMTASARCPICYGTTFVGGYVPISTKMRVLSPTAELKSRREMGLEIDNKTRAWLVTYPLVHSMDVVVRLNNQRYRITEVTPGITGGVLTRQTFVIDEIEPHDAAYLVPTV